MQTVIGIPFVEHVNQELRPTIENAKDYLKQVYSNKFHGQISDLRSYGYVKIMGYRYNFKPLLKKFIYKQYGVWTEAYAPNKTLLRSSVYGRIDQIIELTK